MIGISDQNHEYFHVTSNVTLEAKLILFSHTARRSDIHAYERHKCKSDRKTPDRKTTSSNVITPDEFKYPRHETPYTQYSQVQVGVRRRKVRGGETVTTIIPEYAYTNRIFDFHLNYTGECVFVLI